MSAERQRDGTPPAKCAMKTCDSGHDIAYVHAQPLFIVYSTFRSPPSVLGGPSLTFGLQFGVILAFERVRLDEEECGEERENAAGDHEVVDSLQTAR